LLLQDEINNAADTGATQLVVGFDHKLAKTTSVYAVYTALTNGEAINYSLVDASTRQWIHCNWQRFKSKGNGSGCKTRVLNLVRPELPVKIVR
jgi:predicted porin